MARITSGQFTVPTNEDAIVGTFHNQPSRIIIHQPTGPEKVYLGPPGVTTSTGMSLSAGSYVEFSMPPMTCLHAIAEAGNLTLQYIQLEA